MFIQRLDNGPQGTETESQCCCYYLTLLSNKFKFKQCIECSVLPRAPTQSFLCWKSLTSPPSSSHLTNFFERDLLKTLKALEALQLVPACVGGAEDDMLTLTLLPVLPLLVTVLHKDFIMTSSSYSPLLTAPTLTSTSLPTILS